VRHIVDDDIHAGVIRLDGKELQLVAQPGQVFEQAINAPIGQFPAAGGEQARYKITTLAHSPLRQALPNVGCQIVQRALA